MTTSDGTLAPAGPAGGSGFNATTETMESAAGHVEQVRDQIAQLLSRVGGTVEQLSGAVWGGTAQGTFSTVMDEWQQQSRKLNEALDGIAGTLRGNSASFDSADHDASASIRRVASAGPLNL